MEATLKPVSRQVWYQRQQKRRGRCIRCPRPSLIENECRRHFIRKLIRQHRIVVGESGKPLAASARAERDRLVQALSTRFTRMLKSQWRPVSPRWALEVAKGYHVPEGSIAGLARVIRRLDVVASRRRAS